MTATFAFAATLVSAKVELPDIISDNAVLQQNSDAKLWGWSSPGNSIQVTRSWNGKTYTTKADNKTGRWELNVQTPEASFTPYSIEFKDKDGAVSINNVLIGEVWLCSGQSNMEMPLKGFGVAPVEGAGKTIAYSGNYPGIRMANVARHTSYTEQDRAEGKWNLSNPKNAPEFSAVGYYFAQALSDLLHVPIGIINCSFGGTKLEGWMPKWKLDTYEGRDMAAEEKNTDLSECERIGIMYNGMLKPIEGYNLKGFLWNQGESNIGCQHEYPDHQKDLVEIWRNEWGLGELPFYFVEIPGFYYGDANKDYAAIFRECQHKAAEIIPNSGIICTSDLIYPHESEEVHGSKKKEIGERLAYMAGARTYGIEGLPHIYPSYKSVELKGDTAVVTFNNAIGGLNPYKDIEGFEVAGEDRVFYPAKASEDTNWPFSITVSSDKVSDIKSVRYCFKNFAIGSLKDMYGLPLIPFRTDNW